jgi:UDP-N-acetylglucosamine 2-epimerase (non-hydrolysing)
VVRQSTERPESLGDFATLVRPGPDVGIRLRRTLADVTQVHQHLAGVRSPFGDGTASSQIKQAIDALIEGE